MNIMLFFLGMFVYFFIARYADAIAKQAGKECGYDCERCTCHCQGWHCYYARKNAEFGKTNFEDEKVGENDAVSLE